MQLKKTAWCESQMAYTRGSRTRRYDAPPRPQNPPHFGQRYHRRKQKYNMLRSLWYMMLYDVLADTNSPKKNAQKRPETLKKHQKKQKKM